ncbi:MAG: translation elongation factor Ts [Deltaproteobacteria bacterium]|nr:translation elongation factor Ts [Deltaproteobacteria bacterium]
MTEISAEKVRELREKSGAGLMDCKRALVAVSGHIVSKDETCGGVVELNCETDFVARTDQFQNFLSSVVNQLVANKVKDLSSLLSLKFEKSTVQEALAQLIAQLGENMGIRRVRLVTGTAGEKVGEYIHAGSKIGVLVRLKGEKSTSALAREIAMHVAAMNPRYIHRSQVPADVLEREKEIAKASPDLAGKPEAILEKILVGKLNRFYNEACLVEQPFIKDPTGKKSVGDFLKENAAGSEILEVCRFQVGEEVS